jgi:hypothetical protein
MCRTLKAHYALEMNKCFISFERASIYYFLTSKNGFRACYMGFRIHNHLLQGSERILNSKSSMAEREGAIN